MMNFGFWMRNSGQLEGGVQHVLNYCFVVADTVITIDVSNVIQVSSGIAPERREVDFLRPCTQVDAPE